MKIIKNTLRRAQEQGIINQQQNKQIIEIADEVASEKSSNRWIFAISIFGAIFLGIAAILFISANWQEMSRFLKLSMAIGVTFSALVLGQIFCHQKLPLLGKSLIFLAAIFFGATTGLISQMFHVDGPAWGLPALWGMGTLPLAYIFRVKPLLVLGILLNFIAFLIFLTGNNLDVSIWRFFMFIGGIFENLFAIALTAFGVFAIGSLHFCSKNFQDFAAIYRMLGAKIILLFLFVCTFPHGPSFLVEEFVPLAFDGRSVCLFALIAISIATMSGLRLHKKINTIEFSAFLCNILVLTGLMLWSSQIQSTNLSPTINLLMQGAFNLIFVTNIAAAGYVSLQRQNLKMLNFTLLMASAFVIAKYFQFFGDLLEGASFFFVSGVLLIMGGYFLEKYRRILKSKIKKQ